MMQKKATDTTVPCSEPSIQKLWIVASIIFSLTLLLYTPALNNGFVWDDVDYISENAMIYSLNIHTLYEMLTSFHASNWHPLTWLSLALDYAFFGTRPFGYHLTNIIMHALNTLLIFFLTIRLFRTTQESTNVLPPAKGKPSATIQSLMVASITALLFGLHPLHVESVAWITERKDLLCTLFILLSILSYLSYTASVAKTQQRTRFISCLFLFICALMSKPMAVTLPLLLLLLDIYPLKRIHFSSDKIVKSLVVFKEKIPFLVLSIVSSSITIIAQHKGGAIRSLEQFPIDERLLNSIRSLVFYLEKMVIPVKLVPFYPFPTHLQWFDFQYLLSGILVLVTTGLCVWMVKRGRYLFCISCSYYMITLLPVLGIIQVGEQAAADRYTYLPSISIFLLLGIGITGIFERCSLTKYKNICQGLVLLLISVIMFSLAQLTIKQIRIWYDSKNLWSYVLNEFPESAPNAHLNLGSDYIVKGMLDEAIVESRKAIKINPNLEKAHTNLGLAYMKKGMLDEALIEHKKALSINPNLSGAHNNLGNVYTKKGMLDEAIAEYKKALALKPTLAEAHTNLSIIYYSQKNFKLAILHCEKAIELKGIVNPKLLELLKPHR